MKSPLSIQQKSSTGYLLVLLLLLIMGALLFQSYHGFIEAVAARKLSQETEIAVEHLKNDIQEVEIAQRGIRLTGDKVYTDLFRNASVRLDQDLQQILNYTRTEAEQFKRVQALQAQAHIRLRELEQEWYRKPSNTTPSIAQSKREIAWLRQSNQLTEAINREENRQYNQYDSAFELHLKRTMWINYLLAFLIIIILGALYFSLNREISKRQEAQEALQHAKELAEEANRQKTRILSYVAHDFKNPLAAIGRFIEILKGENSGFSPNQQALINYISAGIGNLQAMVTDILDKAKMEEGRLALSPAWIELKPLLSELEPIFITMAQPNHVRISLDIQPDITGINADPRFFRHILLNLVSNAVKYNKPGGQVFIRVYNGPDPHFIQLEVEDTGIGIPAEQLPYLFQDYFRVKRQTPEAVEGTGLGLAFIKNLVEMHGGVIQVNSILDVGSTFTVFLPVNPDVEAPLTPQACQAPIRQD